MEPKHMNLQQEIQKLEQQGNAMQESGNVFELQLGVAVIEAVSKAREVLLQAQTEAKAAKDVVSGLKGIKDLPESMMKVISELKATDDKLSAVALAYKEGTEAQQKAFAEALAKHTESLQKVFSDISAKQKEAEAKQEKVIASALKASVETVQNLIQELEDGVKVSIENQEKLPVVGFSQGKIRGVDQAIPVMLVDESGRPTKSGSGAAAAGGFIGAELLNDPLIEYRPSDADEATSTKYYGFLTRDGRWYILRETGGNTWRYARGAGNYDTAVTGAWATRAAQVYDYFHNTF